MKIFAEKKHYRQDNRYYLNDIIKSLWNDLTREQRNCTYGDWTSLYAFEADINEADACLLTFKWNYYVDHHLEELAAAEVEQAHLANKPVIIFSEGDFTAKIPFTNVILFEMSGYRSRKQAYTSYGAPPKINDLQKEYCSHQFIPRRKNERPRVGFCGQAAGSFIDFGLREIRNRFTRLSYQAGWRTWEPPPFETSRFRKQIVDVFTYQPEIDTNFILRKKYRAGIRSTQDQSHATRLEFIQNILGSDYTLCMRGGGNFSVRFYETLSLGRIPIFFDSDCLLPWQDTIDYKKYFLWIDQREIPYAAEKLLDFHAQLTADDFEALQIICRNLWVNYLSTNGFYQEFHRHFCQPCKS